MMRSTIPKAALLIVLMACTSCSMLKSRSSGVPSEYLNDVGYSHSPRLNIIYLAGYRQGTMKGLTEAPRYTENGAIQSTGSVVDFFPKTDEERAFEAGYLAGKRQASSKVNEVFDNVSGYFLKDVDLDMDEFGKPNQ